MWPTLCVINEVPLSVHKSNVLMASLWFGRSDKPPRSVILIPFVNEIKTLSTDVFHWKYNGATMLMKVFALLFTSDAVVTNLMLLMGVISVCKRMKLSKEEGALNGSITLSSHI